MHFYNSYIETGELKPRFLAIFNLPKYLVAVLLMVEGLFSLLFYSESDINQNTGQITLGLSLWLFELSWFKNIALPFHLRMIPCDFVRCLHLLSEIISLVFFFSVQCMKKSTFLNINLNEWQPIVPSSPNQLLVVLLEVNKIFW